MAKKKPKKPTFNAFGCLNVGQSCRGNSANCRSGICGGKKPKKGEKDKSTCVAHNVGFCGGFRSVGEPDCRVCAKDTDCQAEFGPGAACVLFGDSCTAICAATGGTVCVPPCA